MPEKESPGRDTVEAVFEVSGVSTEAIDAVKFITLGTFTLPDNITLLPEGIYPNNIINFHNKTFTCVTIPYSPFQIKPTNGSTKWTGLVFEILDELARTLNFTYVVTDRGHGWGSRTNGTWNGMLYDLILETYDFSAAAFTITEEREQDFDFTYSFYQEANTILQKRATEKSRQFFFKDPFAYEVWICLGASILLTGPLLWFVNGYTPAYKNNPYTLTKSTIPMFHISNCTWYIYGAYVQQGGIWLPGAQSARILVFSWWFFIIVTNATYSGNLIAYLTFPVVELPFNKLDDLLAQDKVGWTVADSVAFRSAMENAEPDTVYGKLWSGIQSNKEKYLVKDLDEAMKSMKKQYEYAYLEERTILENAIAQDFELDKKCRWSLAEKTNDYFQVNFGMPFQRNSPYLIPFNRGIMRMLEAGLDKKWIQKYWPLSNKCLATTSTSTARPVNIEDAVGIFITYGTMMAAAMLALLLEFLYSKCCINSCQHRNTQTTKGLDESQNGMVDKSPTLWGFESWLDPKPRNATWFENNQVLLMQMVLEKFDTAGRKKFKKARGVKRISAESSSVNVPRVRAAGNAGSGSARTTDTVIGSTDNAWVNNYNQY